MFSGNGRWLSNLGKARFSLYLAIFVLLWIATPAVRAQTAEEARRESLSSKRLSISH